MAQNEKKKPDTEKSEKRQEIKSVTEIRKQDEERVPVM
jgi:hypothetical protein